MARVSIFEVLMFSFLKWLFGTAQERTLRKYKKIVDEVNKEEQKLLALTDDELLAKTNEFRGRIANGETLDLLLVEAYAVVKNCCRRLLGTDVHVSGYQQKWDMVPYDVQILGAIALHYGAIAESQTGEGKTLTAVMPLYLNALTGKSVHIVTVNDYLAKRDCEWVGSVLRKLGLTTGVIQQGMSHDERKAVYCSDVVYGTASEFGFDYLRDNSMAMTVDDQVQRGHFFALIDEADSILIDEARTPLIISGPSAASKHMYAELRDGVSMLVHRQRDECQRLALEAKKELQRFSEDQADALVLTDAEHDACQRLWLVSKGTPKNKILKKLKENPDIRAAIDKWDLHYYKEQNKELRAEALAQLYIIVDERANEFELTEKGTQAWIECGGKNDDFVMLDLGAELVLVDQDLVLTAEEKLQRKIDIQKEDSIRKERSHNLRQLLRAHLLMERDVDYIIQDSKIVIIDEHTGRMQPGRRYSDGLHQAIEAKENVPIQRETQTYATITLQNYFRMYEKISGMTGTAITEAHEFKEIYKLTVLQIPTYKPCQRDDSNDEMYMTEREKYSAILAEVKKITAEGRPILLGTESVEVSEKLSRLFKLNRLEHTVLNAKNHSREAEIIAMAGQRGAITIATNMAGRGTDIKLGPGVAAIGGLHVIGSTRHQSRRIDRQLRGRSGRLGDPGSSKFYVSLEDPLMRLFASPQLTAWLQRFRPPEGEPISASILNKSIETAQKRVESRNYTIRKHTLEYDDVMNKQRAEIYSFRNELLHTTTPIDVVLDIAEQMVIRAADFFLADSSDESKLKFRQWLATVAPVSFDNKFLHASLSSEGIGRLVAERLTQELREKLIFEQKKVEELSTPEEGERVIKGMVQSIALRTVDNLWQGHLLEMDHLRSDVHLRAIGQKDPLIEFKHEAFRLFDALTVRLREEIVRVLFKFQIIASLEQQMREQEREEEELEEVEFESDRPFFPEVQAMENHAPTADVAHAQLPVKSIELGPRVGRNDDCPCGSGKKFKKCCCVGQGAGKDE
jgi:preprotein translocase subunit SecA